MSKTFIVTGASGGIGIQIVKLLLEEGGIVIATDINESSLQELKSEFSKYQDRLITEILDVRKIELWEKRNGHIINIASLAAISPVPGIALYSASKFAVRGFTLALAMELEEYNVHVTCVCPDAVATPMLDLQKDYEEAAITFSGSNALSAEEVAALIVDLIGEKKMEVTITRSRGFQAKLASMFPSIASKVVSIMKAKGIRNQNRFKSKLD